MAKRNRRANRHCGPFQRVLSKVSSYASTAHPNSSVGATCNLCGVADHCNLLGKEAATVTRRTNKGATILRAHDKCRRRGCET